jgi:hypothetical protein
LLFFLFIFNLKFGKYLNQYRKDYKNSHFGCSIFINPPPTGSNWFNPCDQCSPRSDSTSVISDHGLHCALLNQYVFKQFTKNDFVQIEKWTGPFMIFRVDRVNSKFIPNFDSNSSHLSKFLVLILLCFVVFMLFACFYCCNIHPAPQSL